MPTSNYLYTGTAPDSDQTNSDARARILELMKKKPKDFNLQDGMSSDWLNQLHQAHSSLQQTGDDYAGTDELEDSPAEDDEELSADSVYPPELDPADQPQLNARKESPVISRAKGFTSSDGVQKYIKSYQNSAGKDIFDYYKKRNCYNRRCTDCGRFASNCMRAVDPHFPESGSSAIKEYVDNNYTHGNVKDSAGNVRTDQLRPGDVLWRDGHVAIYGGAEPKYDKSGKPIFKNGKPVMAYSIYAASFGDHPPKLQYSTDVNFDTWGRPKNSGK